MNSTSVKPEDIPVGVVGLGLMGCSIVSCMLMAGHEVVAIAPVSQDMITAPSRILEDLTRAQQQGITNVEPGVYNARLTITEDFGALKNCRVVIECTLEDLSIKKGVFEKIEAVVADNAIITSNTSAIPITVLQKLTSIPDRFFGLHWVTPAYTTRFLEIICGDLSDVGKMEWLHELSKAWGKEAILVRKDIRGFIANRLNYAMFREAFFLVENGYATVEDVDRACRNNNGYWMTLTGIFRWMDLTGVAAYHAVMKDLFPTLNNQTEVPKLIDDIVKAGGRGVSNAQGFYDYTPEEAAMWQETYEAFSYEIRQLALKYPADVVKQRLT